MSINKIFDSQGKRAFAIRVQPRIKICPRRDWYKVGSIKNLVAGNVNFLFSRKKNCNSRNKSPRPFLNALRLRLRKRLSVESNFTDKDAIGRNISLVICSLGPPNAHAMLLMRRCLWESAKSPFSRRHTSFDNVAYFILNSKVPAWIKIHTRAGYLRSALRRGQLLDDEFSISARYCQPVLAQHWITVG